MTPEQEEPYTTEELSRLVDWIIAFPPNHEGMIRYQIRGQYVSATVIENALRERLEKILDA